MTKNAAPKAASKKISGGRNLNIRIPEDICVGLDAMEGATGENPAPAIRGAIRGMLRLAGYLKEEKK